MNNNTEKFDIYQAVTDRMISMMEQGRIPWEKPWSGSANIVRHVGGKPYSLLNQIMLGEPGEYLSFLQCKNEGGSIRKGAKARMVVFFKQMCYLNQDKSGNVILNDDGKPTFRVVPYLRYSRVFHVHDCEGIKERWAADTYETTQDADAEKVAADYCKRTGVKLDHERGDSAYYSPRRDTVVVPCRDQFPEMSEYYSTVFHELSHSTGHPSRLNRFAVNESAGFGSDSYSREELVAEISTCAILNALGLETRTSFRNNTAYVQSWLKALKNDKRMVVTAAGRAEKAARLILNRADEQEDE